MAASLSRGPIRVVPDVQSGAGGQIIVVWTQRRNRTIPSLEKPRLLRRASDGRMVAGVAAGLAEYFDVDVTLVRIAFVALALLGGWPSRSTWRPGC